MTIATSDMFSKKHSAPAYHYLMFSQDEVLINNFSGFQDVEQELQVNDSTSFHAFSTTKTFTAVAVMQLVEQGKVDLKTNIQDYLPEYAFSKPITVRQLLSHQSGLANPIPLKWVHVATKHDAFDPEVFANRIILDNLTVKRKPGSKFAYSNLNYIVLGQLIEAVTGTSYADYITQNVLARLETSAYIGFEHPNNNHAVGYYANTWTQNLMLSLLLDKRQLTTDGNKEWRAFKPFYVNGQAYGGLLASPHALMAYCQSLLRDDLLNHDSRLSLFQEQTNAKGKLTGMALGWFVSELNGTTYYCHTGGGGGYYAEIRIYPSLGLGSVLMTNNSGMRDLRVLDELDHTQLENYKHKNE